MIRLGQASRKLNIGIYTASELLKARGYENIECNPNAKITFEQLDVLSEELYFKKIIDNNLSIKKDHLIYVKAILKTDLKTSCNYSLEEVKLLHKEISSSLEPPQNISADNFYTFYLYVKSLILNIHRNKIAKYKRNNKNSILNGFKTLKNIKNKFFQSLRNILSPLLFYIFPKDEEEITYSKMGFSL